MKRSRLATRAALVASVFAVAACDSSGAAGTVTGTGSIEADGVTIAAQRPGRVRQVLADEGDAVAAGDVLIRLDAALIDAQIDEARAAREAARARLDAVTAEARPEAVQAAEAEVVAAVARRDGARLLWQDAQAMVEEPQEIEGRLVEARAQADLARVRVKHARRALTAATALAAGATGAEAKAAAGQEDLAAAAVDEAVAAQEGADASVRALTSMRDDPVELEAAVDEANAEYRQAQAAVKAASAKVELLTAVPTDEEVAAARAAMQEAEAALDALQAQRAEMTLRAPADGVVLSRSVEVGEIAPAGVSLLRLADMDRVKLEVFVPEGSLADVGIGQGVTVRVDAYGDEEFHGEVTTIADKAQFTPRNVQTAAERANLVFAVTITLENPEHRLRPGMPAEVTLASSGQ